MVKTYYFLKKLHNKTWAVPPVSDSSGNATEHDVKNIKFKPVIFARLLWCAADAVNKTVFEENAASNVHQKDDWAGSDSCNLPRPYWIHVYCRAVVFICSSDYLLAGKTLALLTLGQPDSSYSQSQRNILLQPCPKRPKWEISCDCWCNFSHHTFEDW